MFATATNVAPHDQEQTPLAAALEYAGRGWPVLALVPGQKYPLADVDQPHGCNSPLYDPATIRAMFERHPGANVGHSTGIAFDAVDYDGPHAVPLAKSHGLVAPVTRSVRSARGGFHVYVAHDDAIPSKARVLQADCDCKDEAGALHPCGVDTRGSGGLIVAPPSRFEGRPYTLLRDANIAEWPEFAALCRSLAPAPIPPRAPRPKMTGDSLIDRIKAAWSVEELAERLGARLIGQGDTLKAKCPLHRERNGHSFVIWRNAQKWKCFGKCAVLLPSDVVDLYRMARERGMI